jgi:hypothetical protein
MFEGCRLPSRVRTLQSTCPAREQASFCVFRTGRQDCEVPEGRKTLWELCQRSEPSSKGIRRGQVERGRELPYPSEIEKGKEGQMRIDLIFCAI